MKTYKNFDLTNYNAYRLNSFCSRALFPETMNELVSLVAGFGGDRFQLLGSGHNVILSKKFYDEPFVILARNFSSMSLKGTNITADAGARLEELSQIAADHSLSGLEPFYDIPSSVGGAVVMNAGNADAEISQFLISITYYCLATNEMRSIDAKDCGFIYRNSIFQDDQTKLILSAELKLKEGDKDNIWKKMMSIKEARWAKQPRTLPNCGSVFKRPKGYFVGALIDGVGLRGSEVGGAQISPKHAGIIVNNGNATGVDILTLIRRAQQTVMEQCGVMLEVEQRII